MFGLRSDGKRIKNLPPIQRIMPHIMKARHDSQNLFKYPCRCEPLDAFIAGQKENDISYNYMHLVIASLVQFVEMFIKKYSPALYKSLGVYLPLITTNCAVLGVAQGNTDQGLSFGRSMANALGTSIGFCLIIIVFSCIRTRLEASNTPKALKGVPIALITAAIMSLAFLGLAGIINI